MGSTPMLVSCGWKRQEGQMAGSNGWIGDGWSGNGRSGNGLSGNGRSGNGCRVKTAEKGGVESCPRRMQKGDQQEPHNLRDTSSLRHARPDMT